MGRGTLPIPPCLTYRVMRPLLVALLLVLLAAAPAAAATLSLTAEPSSGVVLGGSHELRGTVEEAGEPLADEAVILTARALRGPRRFAPLGRTTTGSRGGFAFEKAFDRNVAIRVTAAGERRTRRLYVFPRARIADRTVGRNRVQLIQYLRGPKDVRILGASRFYLGRPHAARAPAVGVARVRRRRAGRYVARLTVRVPKRYKGRFSYAVCFRASRRSGMGDPAEACPRRRFSFEDAD